MLPKNLVSKAFLAQLNNCSLPCPCKHPIRKSSGEICIASIKPSEGSSHGLHCEAISQSRMSAAGMSFAGVTLGYKGLAGKDIDIIIIIIIIIIRLGTETICTNLRVKMLVPNPHPPTHRFHHSHAHLEGVPLKPLHVKGQACCWLLFSRS